MKNITINKLYLLLFLVAGIAMASCQKKAIDKYNDGPFINMTTQSDTISVSFDLMPKDDSVFAFPLNVIGYAVNHDRSVKINTSGTAVAGTHFDIPECIIPANKVLDTLKCIVHKTTDVTETNFKYITLELAPSNEFQPGVTTKVTIALKAGLPTVWSEDFLDNLFCEYAYGAYSKTKFRFMVTEMGTADIVKMAGDYSAWDAYHLFLNARLDAYEAIHGPLIDENNNKVTFPL